MPTQQLGCPALSSYTRDSGKGLVGVFLRVLKLLLSMVERTKCAKLAQGEEVSPIHKKSLGKVMCKPDLSLALTWVQ